jgi:cystathionine gamma-synthase
MKFDTLAVHAGGEADKSTGSVAPPIHLSTNFLHGAASEELHGYMYVRDKNPTQDRLEAAMSALEGGEGALVFSSGMGASAALMQNLEPNSHIIIPEDVYVHLRVLAARFLGKWQVQHSIVDMTSLEAVKAALRPNTKLVWVETPSNPCMNITDIAAVAELTHGVGADLLVDNTFATPVLQRPLELGADIVLHSTTKYCGGHSDVQGGCLVFKKQAPLQEQLFHVRMVLGPVCSPFNSWLVLRGLRTLVCRIERHSANAMAVAKALAAEQNIEQVFYPGLDSHKGHKIAARQMKKFGGMMAVTVKGGWDAAVRMASRVKLFATATSLGGVESLVEHRASAEGEGTTSPRNLLRLSIGLEDPEDLIEDLRQALN